MLYEKVKEKPKYTRNKDLVVYEEGETNLKTQLTDCLKCVYSGEQYLKEDCRIMTYDEAYKRILEAEEKKYIKPLIEINEEKFFYMLEVLPPLQWKTLEEIEIFSMSEKLCGDITGYYFKYKNKYYSANRRIKDLEKIKKDFLEEIKNV
ncbi:MAG: DUF1419 domain-containing protein [Nanoarchaeota archaeon]